MRSTASTLMTPSKQQRRDQVPAAAPPTRPARRPRKPIYQTGPFGAYLCKPTPAELAEFAVDHGHHAERLHRFINDRPER
ncbi:hypothetical protein AB0F91_45190 [Amycolatopsis sp. NPDC023774]|uniref:hypothetical protein n=1 Tax=Amycolatopsis sp. NPDC023774 TaxID=3155015 RepID=UPI0033C24BDC